MDNITVREFTMKMWYGTKIAIIRKNDFSSDIDKIEDKALMFGTGNQLRSINYDEINKMTVNNYGVLDGVLVIEVNE